MKYFVSDTKKLPNKYGKWYWYADEECKTFQNDDHLVIYAGYVISEETIDEVVARNPHELEQANGSYWAVILTQNTAKVVLDYFCQTKCFWRNDGKIEFSNAIYLMPLETADVNVKELIRRLGQYSEEELAYQPIETFESFRDYIVDSGTYNRVHQEPTELKKFYQTPQDAEKMKGFYVSQGYAGVDAYRFEKVDNTYDFLAIDEPPILSKQYDASQCMTFFNDVYLLQPDFMFTAVDDKVEIIRIHDTYRDMISAMRSEAEYTDRDKLEEYIHKCFTEHSDIIKKQYKGKHIVSSVSEGIDSATQDVYFPDVKKIAYSFDPPNCPLDFKQDMVRYWKERGNDVQWDIFDIRNENIAKITKDHIKDPTCFYWDSGPSYWQIGILDKKPDVILYGQCGDQMFLHKPFFYFEYMFCQMMKRKDLTGEEKLEQFNKEIKHFRNNFRADKIKEWTAENNVTNYYSSADNILEEPKTHTWESAFYGMTKEDLLKELEEDDQDGWMHDFTKKATPPLYNREVSINADTLVTSLYCDKRIFFKIMNASNDVMIDSIKHCSIQKNILRKYHNYHIRTPSKDQVELNMVGARKPMHTDCIKFCMKDHLPKA